MSQATKIKRDGFVYSNGQLCTERGGVERMTRDKLENMFLPQLNKEGKKKMKTNGRSFVRGQLKHYGVSFEEKDFKGNGTRLLQKAIREGKCDKVPDDILALEAEMFRDWLAACPLGQISNKPQWVMIKCFGGEDQPDRSIRTNVASVSYDRGNNSIVAEVEDAARRVTGLHQLTVAGIKKTCVYLGWNLADVKKSVEMHAGQVISDFKNEQDSNSLGAKEHADYCSQSEKTTSPVGSYVVYCKEIHDRWKDLEGLRLDIHATDEPGILRAEFDFRVSVGVMILGADKHLFDKYRTRGGNVGDPDNDKDGDYEGSGKGKTAITGSKRTAPAQYGSGPSSGPKKPKVTPVCSYLLDITVRETGGRKRVRKSDTGTLIFDSTQFFNFLGNVDLPLQFDGMVFIGQKVSDTPYHRRETLGV